MLIIIEGADKTGKTTLAKKICERFGYAYTHFGPPGKDPATDYGQFLKNLKTPTVCDRFLYGEAVYGPLLRGKRSITDLQVKILERLCRLRGTILIHANTPYTLVEERLKRDGDDLITANQNRNAYNQFIYVLNKAAVLPFYTYHAVDDESPDRFIEEIRPVMESMMNHARTASDVCTGIGSIIGPKIVFVGEKLNGNGTWLGVPFDNGPSSTYLSECMEQAYVNEKRVYVVNSDTLTKEEILFLKLGGCTQFISLGEKANKILFDLNVPHAAVPHPQYWKRFKSKEREAYVGIIRNITYRMCP